MKAAFIEGIRRLRPAPVGAALSRLCRLDQRRLVRTTEGTFYVNPMSILGSQVVRGQAYEPETLAVMSDFLTSGSVFVDLGANEGYFSVVASRLVGPRGRVIAIEPQSRLQGVIQANLNANDCQNVTVVKAAVAARTQAVHLSLTSEMNTGATSLFPRTRYPLPTEQVQSFTLAELLKEGGIEHCDLMKVDIEGAEYDAFAGSSDVLKQGVIHHISVEVHDSILEKRKVSWGTIHEQIRSCGYRSSHHGDPWVYSFER